VVVVGVAVDVLVMPVALAEVHLPDQAAVNEQGQSPVNGGLGNLDAFLPELEIEAVHVEMPVDLENLLENPLPLGCAPQFPTANIILKYLQLRFHSR
jgi:hypothetical protein